LGETFWARHPHIDFKQAYAMRIALSHAYFTVNAALVWETMRSCLSLNGVLTKFGATFANTINPKLRSHNRSPDDPSRVARALKFFESRAARTVVMCRIQDFCIARKYPFARVRGAVTL
jgi:hypothetical protein